MAKQDDWNHAAQALGGFAGGIATGGAVGMLRGSPTMATYASANSIMQ